jgi:hypothetical protein
VEDLDAFPIQDFEWSYNLAPAAEPPDGKDRRVLEEE